VDSSLNLCVQHIVVRIGGGWDTLENYLNSHYQKAEAIGSAMGEEENVASEVAVQLRAKADRRPEKVRTPANSHDRRY